MKGKKIKVCCVVSSGMTIKYMLKDQLKSLKEAGYDVYVVCSAKEWSEDIKKMGFSVKNITFKRKISPLADLAALFKLFFYFKKEKFDIVHVHTLKPEVYGQIAAKAAKVPIILNTLHGFDFADDDEGLKRKLFLFLERVGAKFSTKVFSISKKIIEVAIKEKIAPQEKFIYLGRDIDVDRFNPERFDKDFIEKKKKELKIGLDKKVIGIIARLVEEKGYIDLFKAMQIVLKDLADLLLLAIGPEEPEKKDGITSDVAKKYNLENNVIFLGARDDVQELYPLMDIFILPTHREGLGASILEAGAMGLPVIATNTGGCPEAVDDGKTGILVPVKAPQELAKAIIYILGNKKKAELMGLAAREKILKEFDKNIVCKRLVGEYDKMTKNKLSLEEEWLNKYTLAAKSGKKEHEVIFQSETGTKTNHLYLLDYFKEPGNNRKLLDVGCAFGTMSKNFHERGFLTYGVDYVPEVVEIAKKNKGINFQVADIYDLPFEDNFFDVVVCEEVLQVIEDPKRAINELKRVLKKNGTLLLTTHNSLSLSGFLRKEKIITYNPYSLKKMMKKEGFHDLRIKGIYIMPRILYALNKLIIRLKINYLFNLLFFIFVFFSHIFYIEAKKQ